MLTKEKINNTRTVKMSLNEKERKVIELLREKDYQTVTVKVQDGNIVHVRVEESIKP